jgi:cathepsin X
MLLSAIILLLIACDSIYSVLAKGYIEFPEEVKSVILTKEPKEYLSMDDLPSAFDWRNINGRNFCSRTLNQKNPSVCGSCWAEAATGALTDRYLIATNGAIQFQLSPQILLNFNRDITGGSCNGGSADKAYDFIYNYGIADDSCAPFIGMNWQWGFDVAAMKEQEDVRSHQCRFCDWFNRCAFVPEPLYNLYGVEEHGAVHGEAAMMAEIYARGPIACSLNSDSPEFCSYKGGIMTKPETGNYTFTDHVVVIAGWGVDTENGVPFWVGRNSYGTQWGEGAGGGWFRLERGRNVFGLETNRCAWAVPKAEDVQRVVSQYKTSLGL